MEAGTRQRFRAPQRAPSVSRGERILASMPDDPAKRRTETMVPSTTASELTNSAPAALMSGSRAGYAAVRLPFNTPHAAKTKPALAKLGNRFPVLKEMPDDLLAG